MFINRKRLEAISAVRTKIKESFQKKVNTFLKPFLKFFFNLIKQRQQKSNNFLGKNKSHGTNPEAATRVVL